MRCYSCDNALTDKETTKKSNTTGEYIDLCELCFTTVEEIFIEQDEKLNEKEEK